MRKFVAATVLLGCILLGYLSTGTSAQGPSATQAGLRPGESVRIFFDPVAAGRTCIVTGVRGDFLGCKTDTDHIGQPNYDRWYNLRLIARIDRPATPE